MSHEQASSPPTGRPRSPATIAPPSAEHEDQPSHTPSSASPSSSLHGPAAAVAAMDFGASRNLSPFQRWTAGASETQFNALAGAVGGFTSGIVTCPLDVIKTKLQAQGGMLSIAKGRHVGHHRIYSGLLGTAGIIWKDEGVRGLYRGLGPIILGYLPTWAVWFTVYNKSKVWMAEHDVQNKNVINFFSSIVAGGSSTIATNPIWVIKTRLMSQSSQGQGTHMSLYPRAGGTPTSRPSIHSSWHYNSTLDAARKMYSSEGILSFYSGLTPALLGLTHVAVQFPVYEFLRTQFTGQGMGEMDGQSETHWLGVLSASMLSKVMASSATYPHEVIRTRLQTQRRPTPGSAYIQGFGGPSEGQGQGQAAAEAKALEPRYRGVVMTFRTILKEEGWRAFYAGMGVNMMRAVPAATVTMMTYELMMKTLRHQKQEALDLLNDEATGSRIHEP